jgi:hypothetical protein
LAAIYLDAIIPVFGVPIGLPTGYSIVRRIKHKPKKRLSRFALNASIIFVSDIFGRFLPSIPQKDGEYRLKELARFGTPFTLSTC